MFFSETLSTRLLIYKTTAMMREEVLMRSDNQVISYIENFVTTAGAEKREEVLELFDNIHRLFPYWVIATCPFLHPDIRYVSRNAQHLFGYSKEYMIENSRMEKFFRMIHEADQEDLFHCFTLMRTTLQNVLPENHQEYRTIMHYRF